MNVFDNITVTKHGVAASSNLKATVCGHIYDLKIGAGLSVDNGTLATAGAMIVSGAGTAASPYNPEYQVYEYADYANSGKPLLVLTPPFCYDDSRRGHNDECYFYNAAGEIARAYELHIDDVYEISAELFSVAPVAADLSGAKHVSYASGKYTIAAEAGSNGFDGILLGQASNGNYYIRVVRI